MIVASLQNHFRIAVEFDAANIGVAAAALIEDPEAIASARSRLDRVTRAVAALEHDTDSELRPGQPILWINTFGASAGDEPIGILRGRIVAPALPLILPDGPILPRYQALVETRWGGYWEHVVREEDVIAVPEYDNAVSNDGGAAATADLIAAALPEKAEGPGSRATGDAPAIPEPRTELGPDL